MPKRKIITVQNAVEIIKKLGSEIRFRGSDTNWEFSSWYDRAVENGYKKSQKTYEKEELLFRAILLDAEDFIGTGRGNYPIIEIWEDGYWGNPYDKSIENALNFNGQNDGHVGINHYW